MGKNENARGVQVPPRAYFYHKFPKTELVVFCYPKPYKKVHNPHNMHNLITIFQRQFCDCNPTNETEKPNLRLKITTELLPNYYQIFTTTIPHHKRQLKKRGKSLSYSLWFSMYSLKAALIIVALDFPSRNSIISLSVVAKSFVVTNRTFSLSHFFFDSQSGIFIASLPKRYSIITHRKHPVNSKINSQYCYLKTRQNSLPS